MSKQPPESNKEEYKAPLAKQFEMNRDSEDDDYEVVDQRFNDSDFLAQNAKPKNPAPSQVGQ